jgi:hypothetical protein
VVLLVVIDSGLAAHNDSRRPHLAKDVLCQLFLLLKLAVARDAALEVFPCCCRPSDPISCCYLLLLATPPPNYVLPTRVIRRILSLLFFHIRSGRLQGVQLLSTYLHKSRKVLAIAVLQYFNRR